VKYFPVILCALLSGCGVFKKGVPRIEAQGVTVQPPANPGKPATLSTAKDGESLPLPAGTVIRQVETAAVPERAATATEPAKDAVPAKTVTEISLPAPTVWTKTGEATQASTGTVDTSIGLAKVKAEESRVLLYAALGAAAIGAVFVWLKYPTPAMVCGGAAVVFFLAWKVSGLPDWFWGLGAAAIAIAAGLYFGFERAEKSKIP
jgi:hypothetical protein